MKKNISIQISVLVCLHIINIPQQSSSDWTGLGNIVMALKPESKNLLKFVASTNGYIVVISVIA